MQSCGVLRLCWLSLLISMVVPGLTTAADPGVPRNVVSLNLCTDELLLLLADRDQIASWLVKDPTLSWYASSARGYPSNRGLAEEILPLRPDLVLAGEFTTPTTIALLRKLQVPLLQLSMPKSLREVEQHITRVAQALGHSTRGEQVITDMHARLAALPPLPPGTAALTAARWR